MPTPWAFSQNVGGRARGDVSIEIGWERMAEARDEIPLAEQGARRRLATANY